MSERTHTRRTVLETVGAAAVAATVPATVSATEEWTGVESPTGNTLHDVEYTSVGAYAVGGGGKVYDLTDGRWEQEATPTGQNLKAVVRGDVDIAVGAGGTISEH